MLVSCQLSWLATGVRDLDASNWRRLGSRRWVLGKLGVPDQLLEKLTLCLYIPIAAFNFNQPARRRGLNYPSQRFSKCCFCSCGCQKKRNVCLEVCVFLSTGNQCSALLQAGPGDTEQQPRSFWAGRRGNPPGPEDQQGWLPLTKWK